MTQTKALLGRDWREFTSKYNFLLW